MRRTAGNGSRRRPSVLPCVALTGTPGTGKSSVARALRGRVTSSEVSELGLAFDAAWPLAHGGVEVDLARLVPRLLRARGPLPRLIVGHLAHLLPLRGAVVLRCHPVELGRRLGRARRGSASDRRANVEAEATDVILLEALSLGRRVWEVDTTDRSVRSVAGEVARILAHPPRPRVGGLDWLADPTVTDYLLRPAR